MDQKQNKVYVLIESESRPDGDYAAFYAHRAFVSKDEALRIVEYMNQMRGKSSRVKFFVEEVQLDLTERG